MIIDIVLIIIAVIAVIVGYKIGLLRFILHIASLFTGFIISLILIKPVTAIAMKTPLQTYFYDYFLVKLQNSSIFEQLGEDATIIELLQSLGLSEFISSILEVVITNMGLVNGNLVHSIASNITIMVVNMICFIALWIVLSIVIKILKIISEILRKIKLIKFIDGVFGIAYSLICIVVTTYVVVAASYYLQKINSVSEKITPFLTEQYDSSFGLYKYFEDENIIVNIIELFIEEIKVE